MDPSNKSSAFEGSIDAHQHFWKFETVKDAWITDEMKILRQDYLPGQLQPLLEGNGFKGCVAVQADQSEMENAFLLGLAEEHDFIKGVVGWIDLQAENVNERLAFYKTYKKLKGFRHILQGEARRDLMLRPAFKKGIGLLQQHGFTYDILIYPDQLSYVTELVSEFPDQPFVLDHLGKPYIKLKQIDEWAKDIMALSKHEHVSCKLSGIVTEGEWTGWKPGDFRPYLDVVTEAFGTSRLLYGSDWPVCLVAAQYPDLVNLVRDYYSSFSPDEQKKIFGQNAIEFYKLSL
jgi:L-fuconolactonase